MSLDSDNEHIFSTTPPDWGSSLAVRSEDEKRSSFKKDVIKKGPKLTHPVHSISYSHAIVQLPDSCTFFHVPKTTQAIQVTKSLFISSTSIVRQHLISVRTS
jgi:hypothetical protein